METAILVSPRVLRNKQSTAQGLTAILIEFPVSFVPTFTAKKDREGMLLERADALQRSRSRILIIQFILTPGGGTRQGVVVPHNFL